MILITDLTKQLQAIQSEISRLQAQGDPDAEIIALYEKRANRLIDQLSVETYAKYCYIATLDELSKN